MADADPFDAEKAAHPTLLQLRRMGERFPTLTEIVIRQDERMSRLERDFGEVRRDVASYGATSATFAPKWFCWKIV